MTHKTRSETTFNDEELGALVKQLLSFNGDGYTRFAGKTMTERAADAITTLRTQLAEVKTEKEKLGRELNLARYGQPDFSWQVHKEALSEANARADRAEAEVRSLKAAIFGSENYAQDLKCGNFVEMAQTLHAAQKGGLDRAERAEAALAAQPSPDVAALVDALEWYISEDETNEGDEPMPDHGNRSWNEINSYWIEGKRKAEAALALVKGGGE